MNSHGVNTALDVLHGVWRAINRAIMTKDFRVTDSISGAIPSQAQMLLANDPIGQAIALRLHYHGTVRVEHHANKHDIRDGTDVPDVTVSALTLQILNSLFEAHPLRPQEAYALPSVLETLAIHLGQVYSDISGTFEVRCRGDKPPLHTLLPTISCYLPWDTMQPPGPYLAVLRQGHLPPGNDCHPSEKTMQDNVGWCGIVPMRSRHCLGGLIITDTDRVTDSNQVLLSELAALALLLAQQLSLGDEWPGRRAVSALVVNMLNNQVRILEAQVLDPTKPDLVIILRDSFDHEDHEDHKVPERHSDREQAKVKKPQCPGCQKILSWLLFCDRDRDVSLSPPASLSSLQVEKHRSEASATEPAREDEALRNASKSTVMSGGSDGFGSMDLGDESDCT